MYKPFLLNNIMSHIFTQADKQKVIFSGSEEKHMMYSLCGCKSPIYLYAMGGGGEGGGGYLEIGIGAHESGYVHGCFLSPGICIAQSKSSVSQACIGEPSEAPVHRIA